jgi:hypothetical protein
MTPPLTTERKIESRDVLAGAYLPNARGRMLSHAVVVDSDCRVIEVLCRRVDVDNLADRNASDPHAEPSCSACQRAKRKAQR